MDQRPVRQTAPTIALVEVFAPGSDDLARKSRELTLGLLRHSADPFSRYQFAPGHITCTALIVHPSDPRVLFIHHRRLHRWLLPGGHVEPEDESLHLTAAREAEEETGVRLHSSTAAFAGIDVHGIPPKKAEPFHLHHDLIWCFHALSDTVETTEEAREVIWAGPDDWDALGIPESIRRAVRRSQLLTALE